MLDRITIENFKRFGKVDVELGDPVVFVGPNNSGKTSALQALALWDIGLKRWLEKRKGGKTPEKRPGVTINRRDLIAVPVPNAKLLWRNLHIREVSRRKSGQNTENIRINLVVEGFHNGKVWQCGLEYDFANEESLYCRPMRLDEEKDPGRMPIPPEAENVRMAFLPPMSGLASNELRLDPGAVNVRIGEGRTAEVLRNLCYKVNVESEEDWNKLVERIRGLFGVTIDPPQYVAERGEIVMSYSERGRRLDLSSSGRGLQQTLLLLAYMYNNKGAVLLIDEPDAHLEILRQRQIYQVLCDVASANGNQIIAASHSEVLLNEAAGRDVVVAFTGKPHRIDDRGSQVLKSLRDIGFEHYYQAEQTGWVLYLEGSSDLTILRAFAKLTDHEEALNILEKPFVHYVGNQPAEVLRHYFGIREAVPRLKAAAVFDRIERDLPEELKSITTLTWNRREIENYFCCRETLEDYALSLARDRSPGPIFDKAEEEKYLYAMRESIMEVEKALETLGKGSPWDPGTKVSDDFLSPLFDKLFARLGLHNVMKKKNFYELVRFTPKEKMDPEIKEKLDAIVRTASQARPLVDDMI